MGHPTGIANTARQVRWDLEGFVRSAIKPVDVKLDAVQQKAVEDLRRDGYAVVTGYWPRDKALAMREKLEGMLRDEDVDYDSGAYLRVWRDRAIDSGVSRLYHVDKEVPDLSALRNDQWVLDIASAYYRRPFHSGVMMFQHNLQTNENTRYYHVDSFRPEFKSFVYLEDVDEGNGPFAYLRGTHRSHFKRLKQQAKPNGNGSPTGFSPEMLGNLLDREMQICAGAGTLILTDVRGFHRGTPQVERSRSVLVNYILPEPGDLHIDR